MSDHLNDIVNTIRTALADTGRGLNDLVNTPGDADFPYRDGRFEFDIIGRDCAHAAHITIEPITVAEYYERDAAQHRKSV